MVKKSKKSDARKAKAKAAAAKPAAPTPAPVEQHAGNGSAAPPSPQRSIGAHLVDFGERTRIERRFRPETDGTYVWHLYRLEDVVDGVHPVHKGRTSEKQVWVKLDQGSEADMRAKAVKLAGQ